MVSHYEPLDNRPESDFYAGQYAQFGSEAAICIRRETYGEDLGQQGWRSLEEQAAIQTLIAQRSPCRVLDIACGSGGPSLSLVEQTGCRLNGIDVEPAAVALATKLAAERRLGHRAEFTALDGSKPLPFDNASFDVVVCIDAVLHLKDRFAAVADWSRLLRPGGRLIFTDAAVLTGPILIEELIVRASQGSFLLAPIGLNEKVVAASALTLLECEDRTAAVAEIALRWQTARDRHRDELLKQESLEWFERRQRFLSMATELAASGRLSRYFYVAEK
jgi:SAM-dependent methyltransferase